MLVKLMPFALALSIALGGCVVASPDDETSSDRAEDETSEASSAVALGYGSPYGGSAFPGYGSSPGYRPPSPYPSPSYGGYGGNSSPSYGAYGGNWPTSYGGYGGYSAPSYSGYGGYGYGGHSSPPYGGYGGYGYGGHWPPSYGYGGNSPIRVW